MVLTTHLLVGAAIGLKFRNIFLIAILCLISHYLMDALVHFDYMIIKKFKREGIKSSSKELIKILIDFSLGIILILYFCGGKPYPHFILFGMLMTTLPDGLMLGYYIFRKWLKRLSNKNIIAKIILKMLFLQRRLHQGIHYEINNKTLLSNRVPIWPNLAIELLMILIAILFILN